VLTEKVLVSLFLFFRVAKGLYIKGVSVYTHGVTLK
jgi:hypothetical protein